MEAPMHCDKCGEDKVITDAVTGMLVCESCGFVNEDAVYTAAWDFATGEGMGNFVSATDTGARAASRCSARVNGRWVNSNSVYDYNEGREVIAMKKLEDITSLLRLPAERVGEVKYTVEKITQGRWGAGRWFDILIGACIYVIVRQCQLPLTIIEVAVIINCDVSELGRMYNRVIKYLDIKLPDVDLFIFLERAITSFPLFSDIDLEKTNKMMKHGRFLLQCAFQWFLTTGRHPLPIVAAILTFIAEVDEVNVGLEDISKELNVPLHTCKLRYKELQESLVRVGQSSHISSVISLSSTEIMATIKLHGFPLSTCTANVMACFHEKEVDYEFVTVDLVTGAHKKPAFLALNPFGAVPAIQDGDLTLFESRAIIKYLAKKFEGKGSNLLGSTLAEQAIVEQWSQVEAQSFNPACTAIIMQIVFAPVMGGKTDQAVVETNEAKLNKVLDVYEERLSKSKYLAGDFFSVADLPHLSYLNHLVNAAGKGHLVTSRAHVNAWWERISSRPSWVKVLEATKS